MNAAFSNDNESEMIIEMLLERADLQGHLTLEDIEEIIPRSGASAVEEMVVMLNRQGVEVVLSDDEDETEDGISFSDDIDDEDEVDDDDEGVVAGVDKLSSDDTTTLYLREMSKVPLLNKQQEIDLAKRYEACRAMQEVLIREKEMIKEDKLK